MIHIALPYWLDDGRVLMVCVGCFLLGLVCNYMVDLLAGKAVR